MCIVVEANCRITRTRVVCVCARLRARVCACARVYAHEWNMEGKGILPFRACFELTDLGTII